jgi:hypothetical protein
VNTPPSLATHEGKHFMSDRTKSTVTPPPTAAPPKPPTGSDAERHLTFRHAFLVHLPLDVADAMEEMGRGLYQLVLARSLGLPAGSWTQARLRAAVADLRFEAAHLAAIAEERHASSLPLEDALLSERAAAWAVQAEALATRIESALP